MIHAVGPAHSAPGPVGFVHHHLDSPAIRQDKLVIAVVVVAGPAPSADVIVASVRS